MTMRDFDGATAVVTGAAGGLGHALCERFGRAGGLRIAHAQPGMIVGDLGARRDLDRLDLRAGMTRLQRRFEPAAIDVFGARGDRLHGFSCPS